MMEGNNYSLSDIAAITNDGGLGGNNAWLLILFFLICGNGWNRGGDFSQFASAASQNEILMGQKFSDLDNKADRGFTSIGNGISDATYALTQNITTEGRNLQSTLSANQLSSQKNIDDLRFEMAQGFCAVKSEGTANTQRILDELHQDRVRQLEQQVQALQGQVNMCGVVRYPMSLSYNAGNSPFCGCNNNSCGC